MSRSRKRASTAAYAASQPLFDALRIGCEHIEQQKPQLEAARDIVQRLHVKVPVTDTSKEALEHDQYVNCAVRAYALAMEGYATVFEALAAVTAADVSEGREQRVGHDNFVAMAKCARVARDEAQSFDLKPEEAVTVGRKRSRFDGTPAKGEDARSSKSQRLSDQREKSNKRPLNGDAVSTTTPSGNGRGSKQIDNPTNMAHIHRNDSSAKRGKELPSKKGGVSESSRALGEAPIEDKSKPEFERDYISFDADAEPPLPLRAEPLEHRQGGVVYDDVSAEVEARLKQKEERRKAKDKEKKRKRKSDQSVPGAEVEDKQSKKRPKHTGESNIRGIANGNANPPKAGSSSKPKRKEQGDDDQPSRKKRKKSK